MTENERDTHFKNAAELLYYKLQALKGAMPPHINDAEWVRAEQTLIAQFAYDLTMYNLKSFADGVFGGTSYYDPEEIIRDYIPDLTEWPTPKE